MQQQQQQDIPAQVSGDSDRGSSVRIQVDRRDTDAEGPRPSSPQSIRQNLQDGSARNQDRPVPPPPTSPPESPDFHTTHPQTRPGRLQSLLHPVQRLLDRLHSGAHEHHNDASREEGSGDDQHLRIRKRSQSAVSEEDHHQDDGGGVRAGEEQGSADDVGDDFNNEDLDEGGDILAVRSRAPTMDQLRQEVLDDGDTETAKFAVFFIRALKSSSSQDDQQQTIPASVLNDIRIDDMTFEQIEKMLKKLSHGVRQSVGVIGKRAIDLNRYPLDLRYKVEREIVPTILSRYSKLDSGLRIELTGKFSISTSTSHAQLHGSAANAVNATSEATSIFPSFIDKQECWLEFTGTSNVKLIETAFGEVMQFLKYATQGGKSQKTEVYDGRLFHDVDFHDLIALGDIEPNMLKKKRPLNQRPFIKVRKNTVLISMGIVRCVICPNPAISLNPVELFMLFGIGSSDLIDSNSTTSSNGRGSSTRSPVDETSVSKTVEAIQGCLTEIADKKRDEASEFHAYRAILTYVYKSYENLVIDIESRNSAIKDQYKELGYQVSNDHLEDIQGVSKELGSLAASLRSHRMCLEELLGQPIVMAMMALTFLHDTAKERHWQESIETNTAAVLAHPHILSNSRGIERIIVSFWEKFKILEVKLDDVEVEIVTATGQVEKASKDAQTKVLVLNTSITVIATTVGICGYITGAFGMNLDQTLWLTDVPGVFQAVCVATALFITIGSALILSFMSFTGYLPQSSSTRPVTLPKTLVKVGSSAEDKSKIKTMRERWRSAMMKLIRRKTTTKHLTTADQSK